MLQIRSDSAFHRSGESDLRKQSDLLEKGHEIEGVPSFLYRVIFHSKDCHTGKINRSVRWSRTKARSAVRPGNPAVGAHILSFGDGAQDFNPDVRECGSKMFDEG